VRLLDLIARPATGELRPWAHAAFAAVRALRALRARLALPWVRLRVRVVWRWQQFPRWQRVPLALAWRWLLVYPVQFAAVAVWLQLRWLLVMFPLACRDTPTSPACYLGVGRGLVALVREVLHG
jgi:hypothetical protein